CESGERMDPRAVPARDRNRFLRLNGGYGFRRSKTKRNRSYSDPIRPSGTAGRLEPGRYRWIHEWIRSPGINRLYFGRHTHTRLANRARPVQEKIFRSREDGN